MCIFLNFFLLLFIISIILYRPRQLYFRNSVSCHCPVKIEFKKTSFAKEGNKLPIHRRKPIENGFQILTPPPPYCWFGSVQVLESPQESSWRLKTFFRSVFMAKKEKKKKNLVFIHLFSYTLWKKEFFPPLQYLVGTEEFKKGVSTTLQHDKTLNYFIFFLFNCCFLSSVNFYIFFFITFFIFYFSVEKRKKKKIMVW